MNALAMTEPDLARMTKAAKKRLLDKLVYELQPKAEASAEALALWDAAHDALGLRGNMRQPFGKFLIRYGAKRFEELGSYVDAYVTEACGDGLTRPVRMAVTRACLGTLVEHLKVKRIPCTPDSLFNSISILAHAVEACFPGYAEVRLLDRIIVVA